MRSILAFLLLSYTLTQPLLAQDVGVTPSSITLGNTNLMSGPYAYWGQGIKIGLLTHIAAVNATGGVHARSIRVVFYDDQFHPPYALANVQRLHDHDRVFALVGVGGTATNQAMLAYVEQAGLPSIGVLSHAHTFIAPTKHTHFTLYPSYYQQARHLVDYLVTEQEITQHIAVLYEANAFGHEILQGVQERLRHYGLELLTAVAFARGVFDIRPQVEQLHQARAEAVILATIPRELPRIVFEAQDLRFAPVWVGPSSLARQETLEAEVDRLTEQLVVLTPFLDPHSQTPGVEAFRQQLERSYPGHIPQEPELFGYATARIVVEALERAGPHLTRQRFLAALETLMNFDPGTAQPITFTPARHYGSTAVRFIRPHRLRWQPVTAWRTLSEESTMVKPRAVSMSPSTPTSSRAAREFAGD